MKKLHLILCNFLFVVTIHSQEVLSLDQAIKIALANNGNITTSKMNAQVAAMQVYKGNVGLLPSLDWNLNLIASANAVNQEFIDGRIIKRLGRTFAPNTNFSFSWLLFDGKQRQARYNILEEQQQIAAIQTKGTEDQIRYEVMSTYLNISKQVATISYLSAIIKYYEERLKITEERWKIGRGSKLDFLQSQNDINAQRSEMQNALAILDNYKILLNLQMNREANTSFDIIEDTKKTNEYTFDKVMQDALANDESLRVLERSIDITKLQLRDLEANRVPRISFVSALGYNFTNTNAGQILLNQNLGLNGGLTASWNLYDGNHNRKQMSIAAIQTGIIEKEKDNAIQALKAQISIALNQLKSSQSTLRLEEENKKIAEENLSIAIEKFKFGGSTILELNDAQQRYDGAVNRYVNSVYAVKFAELEIKRLML